MSILVLKQLEKRIENTLLFPPFDLEFQRGKTVAVYCHAELGSTLIRIILGELPPSSGEVHFVDSDRSKFFERVGLSLKEEALYERLTAKEYLILFKKLYGAETDVNKLLAKIGLIEKSSVRSGKLSFSEKKRLHFARAILHNPDLIILEEPTQDLDIESTIILHRLIASLEESGKSVFMTTSNLENAISFTSHVFRLDENGLKKIEVTEEEEIAEEVPPIEETVLSEEEANEPEAEISIQMNFNKIPAKVEDKLILFDPTEIDFIESNSGVSNLNVKGETFPCTFTLSDLEKRLQPFGFFRCHRSYIVNLQKVREVITWTRNSYSLILDDKSKSSIPLSKGKLDELKSIIGI